MNEDELRFDFSQVDIDTAILQSLDFYGILHNSGKALILYDDADDMFIMMLFPPTYREELIDLSDEYSVQPEAAVILTYETMVGLKQLIDRSLLERQMVKSDDKMDNGGKGEVN